MIVVVVAVQEVGVGVIIGMIAVMIIFIVTFVVKILECCSNSRCIITVIL